MAAGKNVLAAKISAIEEVCGDAAIYFDPYELENMAEKIREFEKVNISSDTLYEKARTYSWDTTVQRMEQVLLAAVSV